MVDLYNVICRRGLGRCSAVVLLRYPPVQGGAPGQGYQHHHHHQGGEEKEEEAQEGEEEEEVEVHGHRQLGGGGDGRVVRGLPHGRGLER